MIIKKKLNKKKIKSLHLMPKQSKLRRKIKKNLNLSQNKKKKQ